MRFKFLYYREGFGKVCQICGPPHIYYRVSDVPKWMIIYELKLYVILELTGTRMGLAVPQHTRHSIYRGIYSVGGEPASSTPFKLRDIIYLRIGYTPDAALKSKIIAP